MDDRFKILKPGQIVLDLGAAPGSWSQVAVKLVNAPVPTDAVLDGKEAKLVDLAEVRAGPVGNAMPSPTKRSDRNLPQGLVIGVDLLDISPYPGAIFLSNCDFTKEKVQKKIMDLLHGRLVDVVLSDMAPNASGIGQLDHDRIIHLCTEALNFSRNVLVANGSFLCKIWTGQNDQAFREMLRKHFALVRNVKPPASRDDSSELYMLGTGFKKPAVGK